MFTGIITDIGEVVEVGATTDMRAKISCTYDVDTIDIGASIACSGVCLTVVDKGRQSGKGWFKVDISVETIAKTTAGSWAAGTRLNLERALKVGDELGGHMVSGHVDGLAEIISVQSVGDSKCFRLSVAENFTRYIAQKGSICLDGTSFTVNEVSVCEFEINIIPHTLQVTTWGDKRIGDKVNLEIDVIARYVARLNSETAL
jgi:riboflavin synthase